MKQVEDSDDFRVLGGSCWKKQEAKSEIHPDQQITNDTKSDNKSKYRKYTIISALVLLLMGGLIYKYLEYHFYGFNYPLTRQQEEVLSSLLRTETAPSSGVTFSTDEYLGVKLKLYKIEGLKAELRDSFPSLEDENIYLITRSSDYRFHEDKKEIIGDYVRGGQLLSKSNWRAGYFSILDGQAEIGIGRRPEMRTYMMEHHGAMFRQLALVSAGVKCVSQYILKGKVTRCAYARTINNELYFIETVNPETLYGFSDALIEFGFVDAVYVTGGTQKDLFYRDKFSNRHGDFYDDKAHQMVIWKRN